MRRFGLLPLLLALLAPLALFAQRAVQLGGQRFVPEQNLARGTRLPDAGRLGAALGGQRNALVQLRELPTAADIQALAARGITLGDYLGGHAYHALVAEGAALPSLSGGNRLTALVAVRPEWKLHPALRGGAVPEHARAGADGARVVVRYAANATPAQVAEALGRLGLRDVEVVPAFRAAYAEMPLSASEGVASLPWVLAVDLVPLPPSLFNREGRIIGRASVLNTPAALGGRGLQGRGVRVGIWDASVTQHVDFGNRVHVQEYEDYDPHGTHVTGTILGAGLLNPDARGMAPAAHAYTHNFNTQKNGLSAQQEMAIAKERFNIALTQNSYGIYLAYVCSRLEQIVYSASDYNLDRLACEYPTLQHIFAAGNDQASCGGQLKELYGQARYFTASNRSKNSIHVGAVDRYGDMTGFSSWGPQPDGRMFPTICAKGEGVLSTVPPNGYGRMDGTSMACPTVTGTAALLAERYAQLHQGRDIPNALLRALLANTATDAGRPGPDFQYGYGVMHAEHAAQALENEWFYSGRLQQGGVYAHTITLPASASAVRVMLVWNDPAVAKVYALRDKVLVNDLNLTVRAGGKDWQPWVCDPTAGNLEKDATRGKDNLNNIEQVTLTRAELGSAASLEVTVNAQAVAEGEQGYILTWFFDTLEPRVVSPADGMLCAAGEDVLLAVEGIESPYTVDLSYDGGASWTSIGRVAKPYFTLPLGIPADAPITTKALVRVVDAKGHVAKSAHPFTVAPQPKKLQLQQTECGTSGWRLTWEKAETAVNGYVVLQANPDKTGEFEIIGEAATGTPEFDIPSNRIEGVERPVFSVAAKIDNAVYGKRAEGVLGTYSVPVKLSVKNLPFVESFTKYPSRYFSVKAGENIQVKYVNKNYYGDDAVGSNLFGLVCTDRTVGFDQSDYFNTLKNRMNMGALTLCDLDLTDIPADQSVLLHIYGAIGTSSEDDATTARMRVKAGPDGEQILTSIAGKVENTGTTHNADWCYMLPCGQKHKVVIEFSGFDTNDLLAIVSVKVEKPLTDNAVALDLLGVPYDGANLSMGSFKLFLRSKCTNTLKNLVVKAYRNGKWVAQRTIDELKGMTNTEVLMNVDLSTDKPLGELIPLRFECVVNPTDPTKNGYQEYQVNSMGSVMPQGTTTWFNSIFGTVPRDPKITYTVSDRAVYTDNGGVLGNYTDNQQSTVKFLPADPNMKIRMRFTKFKTTDQRAQLLVITSDVPADLSLVNVRIREALMGNVVDDNAPSITFISEAADGGITCFFESLAKSANEGWVAEVDLVPGRNPLAITSASISLIDSKGGETGEVPVRVKIKNRWDNAQKNVVVSVLQGTKFLLIETIPEVLPGEHEYTLNRKLKMPLAYPVPLRVAIEGDDTDASDNEATTTAIYDHYCAISGLPDLGNYTSTVETYDAIAYGSSPKNHTIRYNLKKALFAYKGDGSLEFRLFPGKLAGEGYSVAMWVDWNGNGQFEDSEKQTAAMVKGSKDPIRLIYQNLESYPAGMKRIRIAMAPTADIVDPCTALSKEGDVQDFTIELKEGNYPKANDLGLSMLQIGVSGKNLSSEQEIKFVLNNLSNTDFDGDAKVKITIDNQQPVEETIDCKGPNKLVAYKGSRVIILNRKADFSAVGKHTVAVELLANPIEENNRIEGSVYCAVPANQGLYALNIHSLEQANEKLDGVEVAQKLNSTRYWTIDLIFRIDRPQFGTLLEANGFNLYVTHNMAGGIPSNAIAMQIGRKMLRWTKEGTLLPGIWHHLTVAMADIMDGWYNRECTPAVYIDGQECELEGNGEMDAPSFGGSYDPELAVFSKIDGQLKLLRTSKKALTSSGIMLFQYVRNSDGTLPTDYTSEFTFDEGTKNKLVFSGEMAMELFTDKPERLSATENGIWQKIEALIAGFQFEKQAKVEKTGANSYTITFEKGTDKTQVKGKVLSLWPNTSLKYNGAEITSSTVFDFTSAVEIKAEASLFGKNLQQSVTLTFHEDASNACELLTLKLEASKNPGLLQDMAVDPIAPENLIRIPATAGRLTDASSAKLTFTISEGAKLFCKEAELASGITGIDLSDPVVLTVVAANGAKKNYELQIAQEQTINWSLAKTNYTYGDAPVDVQATLNSPLALTFTSERAEVATVANGKLAIGIPGRTSITAIQPGGGMWDAAQSESKSITVAPKECTVKVKSAQYHVGYPLILAYEYDGLVNPEDVRALPDPFTKGCFTVKDANGVAVVPSGSLPVGTYTVEVDASKSYETSRYKITPANGVFEMTQGDLWHVTITVREGGKPLPDATVLLGQEAITTSANGLADWYLAVGKSYTFTVRKAGYSDAVTTADLSTGRDVALEVELKRATLSLSYSVDGVGGQLVGDLAQMVAPGEDGQPVLATPSRGYEFVKWSDGSSENPHVAKNITQDTEVKASFREITFTLTYRVENGGKFKDGAATQVVKLHGNGEYVEVEAADDEHYFKGWSDGVRTPRRKDMFVSADKELTALFGIYASIPASNDFEEGMGDGWYTLSSGTVKVLWAVTRDALENFEPLEGKFAAIKPDKSMSGKTLKSALYSPCYKLTDGWNSPVVVSMNYAVYTFKGTLKLQICLNNNGVWTDAPRIFTTNFQHGFAKHTIPANDLVGKKSVQFRWHYETLNTYGAELDNIVITTPTTDKLKVKYEASPVGAGTFDQLAADGNVDKPNITEQEVSMGQKPADVVAKPAGNFVFVKWDEGTTTPKLSGQDEVYREVTRTAYFKDPTKATITYRAMPPEAGSIAVDNIEVEAQIVNRGDDAKPAKATAFIGYRFSHWDGPIGGLNETIAPKNVQEDMVLTATFVKIEEGHNAIFTVVNEAGNPLSGATITIASETLTTNAAGQATTTNKLVSGDYNYSVELAGYERIEGVLNVSSLSATARVIMKAVRYTITFTVTDADGGAALSGATIEINGQNLTADANGKATIDLPNGTYPYTAKMDGYEDKTDNITVNGAAVDEAVALTKKATATYTVTFTVTDADGGAALSGATIEINGQTLTADASGVATIDLPNGTYSYTAKMDGYDDKAGNITVNGAAMDEAVALTKKAAATYTVTFTVRDAQPQPLANATIEIAGKTPKTDAKGVATIDLPNGAYPYTVTLDGYKTFRGTAQVQGKDLPIPVTLVKEIFNAVESSLLAGVEAYPNPCDAELHLRNVAALQSLRVVNALGQTVLTRTHDGAETMVVATDTLPAGIYLLHLTDTAGGIHTLRFAKR